MILPITALFAAFLALLFIALALNVSITRGKTGVNFGDGGNAVMLSAVRRHGNMAETVPFALILMAFAELNGLSSGWLYLSGTLLVAARLIHLFGIRAENALFPARVSGVVITYLAMAIPICAILVTQFAG